MINLLDRAVDHQRDQGGFVCFVDPAGTDERAVAQDRHPVAELEHLLEPVTDVNDGDPIRLEPPDQLEQSCRFLAGEISGRLIEDEEFAPRRSARAVATSCCWPMVKDERIAVAGRATPGHPAASARRAPSVCGQAGPRAFPRRREKYSPRRRGAGTARPPDGLR